VFGRVDAMVRQHKNGKQRHGALMQELMLLCTLQLFGMLGLEN
jgi:hypothetical protein